MLSNKVYSSIGKIQLVVSRLFAGDNRLSLDFLLVTTCCQQTLSSKYCYQPPGHIVTGDLKIITNSRIGYIICKGPNYWFPLPIYFKSCREEIAGTLQESCNRWCKREHVESNS